jgi:rhamnosyl/mannosyltransferase
VPSPNAGTGCSYRNYQKLKIIHIYKDYYPIIGGIENYVRTLAEYQSSKGYDVTVLATSPSRKTSIETINGVRVVKTGRIAKISSTPISFSLLRWIKRSDADITHLHFPYPVGEFAHLFLGRSSHTVITYHSDIVKQQLLLLFYRPFLIKVLKKADRIIATSPQYVDTSPFLKIVRKKCIVVPLGIDTSRFGACSEVMSMKIRERYNNNRIVLFVGRLRYFKGLNYLIDAMKSIHAVLLIIGTGPESDTLKAKAGEGSLVNRIFFLGDISDDNLASYYQACDVFVLPSSHRSEAFGTVLIEAMASGRAVVSTELGTGTSFVNIHGKTGLVVPPRDSGMLAEAINMLLSGYSLRQEFAANARKRAEEFSNDVLNQRILQVYSDVLSCNLRII